MNSPLSHIELLNTNFQNRFLELRQNEEIQPLCLNEQIELEIELSTGGPADGFKIYLDKNTRTPLTGRYYYADWGWQEERWLTNNELDLIISYFGIM